MSNFISQYWVAPHCSIICGPERPAWITTQSAALYAKLAKYRARVYLQRCRSLYPGGQWFADVKGA